MTWIKLVGMWLFCDGWFSIHTYWKKEGWKEHYIRIMRMGVGVALMMWG